VTYEPVSTRRPSNAFVPSPIFIGIVAVFGVSAFMAWTGFGNVGVDVFLFVVSGWLVSLCLHEYGHAVVGYFSGDHSVADKGYLRLNPLKYTNIFLSIVLPVVFVILGGIGLPGGAVFIERGRINGRWKHSLISAAGPLVNVACAVALLLPFSLGAFDSVPGPFLAALAFLAMLQVTAAILNLLPVPGLDGYGIVEPWLSYNFRRQVEPFAQFGLLAVFGILWIPEVNTLFFDAVDGIMRAFGVEEWFTYCGQAWFRFWQGNPDMCSAALGG
jgi:Zn-dependent protease